MPWESVAVDDVVVWASVGAVGMSVLTAALGSVVDEELELELEVELVVLELSVVPNCPGASPAMSVRKALVGLLPSILSSLVRNPD